MRVHRTQWIKKPVAPPEPVDTRMQKARRLPMFGPDIEIRVPLALLPEYFALYGLHVMSPGEIRDAEIAAKKRKYGLVVWVNRTPKGDIRNA